MSRLNSEKPSRQFAALAITPPPRKPAALSRRERAALDHGALTARIVEETAYINGLYVPTPRQLECEAEIQHYLDDAKTGIPGPHDSIYVLGPPYTGKSTAVGQAAYRIHRAALQREGQTGSLTPEIRNDGSVDDLVPVVWLTVRSDATMKPVVAQFTHFYGYRTDSTAAELTNHLATLVTRHRTELVVMDDLHNLGTDRADGVKILNLIKNIQTDLGFLGVCFVYLGNPGPGSDGNLTDNEQLATRAVPFTFDNLDFDLNAHHHPEQNLVWRDLLDDWEHALMPVLSDMEPGDLSSTLGVRAYNRTHGSPGALAGLLKRCATRTLREANPRSRLTITRDRMEATAMPSKFLKAVVAA